ncbi:hypothetical protein [Fervidibacter sacchari]
MNYEKQVFVGWRMTNHGKEAIEMALQRWWEETMHDLWYHTLRDEAYMRHHFRQEVEQNLREIVRGQRALQSQIRQILSWAYLRTNGSH